ncbi:VTT domain-containing protein [Olivibacter sp. SDN3]|uniref:DedA family protein n=1 Tax=Olivibacter sp. SDN3 TaxID=2764720 RepID=UPI00165161F5|nr:VTT domain-containing protein [Olivibacter sp. SDN3]QNL49398.1 VTT domain-containing protein [Olivibacter sp. SDN3]
MLDAKSLIDYGGLILIVLSVYAQTGFFFCFFVPSGGLMFTAGILIASGHYNYNIWFVCLLLTLAAAAGNATGYWFGNRTAHLLLKRKNSRFFKKHYLLSAENFYHKYGAVALIVGLFLPIIRTFAPIVSGMIRLNFYRFLLFTSIGSITYVFSFVLAGYLTGKMPFLKPYLTYFVVLFLLLVTTPIIIRIIRTLKQGVNDHKN